MKKPGKVAWLFWMLFVGWFFVLFLLSANPMPHVPGSEFKHIDKVYHAGYFFVGGLLFLAALNFSFEISFGRIAWITVICIALVGVFDEVHQTYTPARQGGDKGDWMADVTGAILAVLVGRVLFFWYRKRGDSLVRPSKSEGV